MGRWAVSDVFLERLGVSLPVLAAPMAGGPTTPALVLAATGAGSLGFLAAGYQQAQTLRRSRSPGWRPRPMRTA